MEQKNSLQFFFLSLIVGMILMVGTFSFTSITKAVLNPDSFSYFKKNTWIGPIEVSGLNKEQTMQLLDKEIAEWEQKNQMTSQFLFETTQLKPDTINFDVQGSVNAALNEQKNSIHVSLNEELWNQHLSELGFSGSEEMIDWSTFKQDLLSLSQDLQSINEPFNLPSYINRKQTGVSEISHAAMPFTLNDASTASWIRKHSTILVETNQTFSLNKIFESEPEGLYSEEFKTILASTVYKAALEGPFHIKHRQISQKNPFNIQAGFEAYITESQDLVVENVYGYPLTIQTTVEGDRLVVTIKGPDLGIEVDIDPLQRKVLPYRVQIQTIDKSMPQKTDKGIEGVEVDLTRTVFISGEKKATYEVAKDLYFPVHEVQYRHEVEPENTTSNGLTDGNSNLSDGNTPSIETGEGNGSHGTIIPPGGTSTDSDPDEILKDDQTKTTK